MANTSPNGIASVFGSARWQRAPPAVTLALLAPIISELLFGSTRLSYVFVLLPEIMGWGCGALIIREIARRWRCGWRGIVLLGLALAIAEECIIQQTSLAPLVGLDPVRAYGRALGVNWVWLLAMLGYETVWVVLVPIQTTELIFPDRRDEPWLGQRGLIVAACLFVLGAFIAWYAWVHRARPLVYHVPPYQPPLATILLAAGAILLLAFATSRIRISHSSAQRGDAPSAWIVGSAAFVLALPWFYLIRLAYGAMPALPVFIPISVGLIWAAIAWLLIARWSSDRGWNDMHRLALIFGAIVASMLAGFGTGRWLAVDLYAKIILNVIAVLLLLYLALRIHRTPAS